MTHASNAQTPIRIGNRLIGPGQEPFIVAEMSGNHNQSLERALAIVEAVARAGADALKLQTYTADTMTLDIRDGAFFVADPENLWQGNTLYELYEKAHTPWEWHGPILQRCRELGLICFSTPFDATAVAFLESLEVPCYKMASLENTDLPLIRQVARTGKPVLISTGMATAAELDETVRTARDAGCRELILLKCASAYPCNPEDSHLRTLPHLRDLFDVPVGLSDHTLGIGVAVASIAFGATVIEKHVTLSRQDGGVDAVFSLEPDELYQLKVETRRAWQALGEVFYGPTPKERKSLIFRRSLYVTEDMAPGERFTPRNLRAIRPGYGLAPKHYDSLLGQSIRRAVKRGTPVTWDLVLGDRLPGEVPSSTERV